MLVLSRQKDESLMIGDERGNGDDVEITIVDVRGDKVRLGINYPKHWSIHRKEVWEAIIRERQELSKSQGEITELDIINKNTKEIEQRKKEMEALGDLPL